MSPPCGDLIRRVHAVEKDHLERERDLSEAREASDESTVRQSGRWRLSRLSTRGCSLTGQNVER